MNATTHALHAPAPPPGRQATPPPDPNLCPAEHPREDDNNGSSLTPTPEASPDVVTSKLVLKHHPRSIPAVTDSKEEASIASGSVGEQFAAQSCVTSGPASAPSRSSSVSLQSLLAVHEGGPQGQHQVDTVGVEDLTFRVSPWVDSPSTIRQRPAEKRKSSHLKEGDYEKRAATRSTGPHPQFPLTRQR